MSSQLFNTHPTQSMQHIPDTQPVLHLFRAMTMAREIDRVEQALTRRGVAPFHVSGAGHESTAVVAEFLTPHDWLHCHYRDKALLLARGLTAKHFFDALLCNGDSSSQGRRMNAFFADRQQKILSMVCPVGNSALQSAGVAASVKHHPAQPLVLCAVGDGTTQQGEFMEACVESVREELPVLFLVEDNGLAISTSTRGKLLYEQAAADAFCGIPITRVEGRNPLEARDILGQVIEQMRASRQPSFVVLDVERLASHTNADDETLYRTSEELKRAREVGDPIARLERDLIAAGISRQQLLQIRAEVTHEVATAEQAALNAQAPMACTTAKKPIPAELSHPSRERRGNEEDGKLTMREAMQGVLHDHLQRDPRVTLYGQDIEDPKGDVFGVTRGLSTEFGARVKNAPLTESTIVGVSVGRALAGERPVAFIQFADFLPLAYNQIVSELSTIYWRTAGEWNAPVILMVACGGYRPGLGPFHAQTFESVMAHAAGIDVLMPSTAADAAGMLNAAFLSGRPTVFLYPKACLNDPKRRTSDDVHTQFVPIGPARKLRAGDDITMVAWGNTVAVCEQVASTLANAGAEAEVIDLRSLSPWDERTVLKSVEKTARLMVVHEDNQTCGFGAEVLATISERTHVPVSMRRVTRPDTHVPCNFDNQLEVLPSYRRVLTTATEMLNIDLSWQKPTVIEEGVHYLDAIGAGPADETVIVSEVVVKDGQTVKLGDPVASLEATKGVFELTSAVDGVVDEILVKEGDCVDVGKPIMRLLIDQVSQQQRNQTLTDDTPILSKRKATSQLIVRTTTKDRRAFEVGLSGLAIAQGSRIVNNAELTSHQKDMQPTDILRRTGIEQRHWVRDGEDAVSLAVDACWSALNQEGMLLDDVDLLICATTSPRSVTPSMACQVLGQLAGSANDTRVQAYDINAACSGYLYALQAGYDYLQSDPDGRVLLVTAEVLSPLLDLHDFDTAILFADASSATVLYGESHCEHAQARVHRPTLSAKGDAAGTLSVPFLNDGFIQMKGQRVFSEAVRSMISSLNQTCRDQDMEVDDLDLIVPHQANQRIIDAVQNRVTPRVYSNIRHHGNTSSTSIPLCLYDVLPTTNKGERLGLCAFGGGFTFGAGVLERI